VYLEHRSYVRHCALACIIPHQPWTRTNRANARDVDDAPAPILLHLGYNGLHREKDGLHIDHEDPVKLVTRDFERGFVPVCRPSVVDLAIISTPKWYLSTKFHVPKYPIYPKQSRPFPQPHANDSPE
jgi:hypothetical protein